MAKGDDKVKPEDNEPRKDEVLSLSTEAVPGIPVEIDGETYEIRAADSLSTEEEVTLRTMNARERRLQETVEQTPADQGPTLDTLNEKLQAIRISMIVMMSNVPSPLVKKLPVQAQFKLVALIAGASPAEVLKRAKEQADAVASGRRP
jgi:hypothetical protein